MPGSGDVLALDDRLVDLHAAGDVVGLDRQEFLEGVCGAVSLKGPHLHLTESLTTELRLTTQRLLRDHGVRAGRAGVELVVDQVVQLEDVHVADRDRVRERLAGAAVEQLGLAGGLHQTHAVAVRDRGLEETGDLVLARTVEDGRGDVGAGGATWSAPMACRRLAHSSPRPETSQPRLASQPRWISRTCPGFIRDGTPSGLRMMSTGGAVLQERHVLDRQDLRDDALVAVTAGELVTVGDLALLRDVDADQLVHARRQLVALFAVEDADADDLADLAVRHLQRGVADLARLLTEDRAEQALLGGSARSHPWA